jgi:nicotinate phosphoribosyltransferase
LADSQGLITDLYELTMAAAYFENRCRDVASFEMFVRRLPRERSFLLCAGLEQAITYLETLRFAPEEIEYLRGQRVFEHVSHDFWEYLANFRFTGEVWAIPEGTPAFAGEPLLRVTAPIIEAQVVETFLLTSVMFQTMIATKSARIVEAAQGRDVVEFGSRRAHGPTAGILGGRAAYIGGCAGTSNVASGHLFGVPIYGTMAHSFVMAYTDEAEAFARFERLFPHSILLIDTYDTVGAIQHLGERGLKPAAVRLDSGDLIETARQVRAGLDATGLRETKIFASGDLDELAISSVLAAGAPIDAFGVGTELATSRDAPVLSAVYKLVEVEIGGRRQYRAKFSESKVSYPGVKQVFRYADASGCYVRDVIGRDEEQHPGATPLLECVMRDGRRLNPCPPLAKIRERAHQLLQHLPRQYRQLRNADRYPVRISDQLEALLAEVREMHQESSPKP